MLDFYGKIFELKEITYRLASSGKAYLVTFDKKCLSTENAAEALKMSEYEYKGAVKKHNGFLIYFRFINAAQTYTVAFHKEEDVKEFVDYLNSILIMNKLTGETT